MLFLCPGNAFSTFLIRGLCMRWLLFGRQGCGLLLVGCAGVGRKRHSSCINVLDVFFQELMTLAYSLCILARNLPCNLLPPRVSRLFRYLRKSGFEALVFLGTVGLFSAEVHPSATLRFVFHSRHTASIRIILVRTHPDGSSFTPCPPHPPCRNPSSTP